MALLSLIDRFPDDAACLKHLEAIRWPKGVVCPHCGSIDRSTDLPRPRYWQCNVCRQQFTALYGTAMEGTHIPLRAGAPGDAASAQRHAGDHTPTAGMSIAATAPAQLRCLWCGHTMHADVNGARNIGSSRAQSDVFQTKAAVLRKLVAQFSERLTRGKGFKRPDGSTADPRLSNQYFAKCVSDVCLSPRGRK